MPDAIVLPRDTQLSLAQDAARSPSAHNVQPARWRFEPNGDVVLFRELGRELPIGDPTAHDLQASLGAAYEGLSLALSRFDMRLTNLRIELVARASGCVPVVRAHLAAGATRDPLAEFVRSRRSYRGTFVPATSDTSALVEGLAGDDAIAVTLPAAIATIASLHESATWHFESQRDYHAELWSWLRLDRHDPRYLRDGLNADCLALSNAERIGARVAMRPGVFAVLSTLGIARYLVSERAQVKSAAGLLLFAPLASANAFDAGRGFYRLWLEMTRAGLHAAPMSASADHAPTRDTIAHAHNVPSNRRLANVLRVGRAPAGAVAESPRLPESELLV